MDLSGVGIWSSQLRYGNADEAADAAAELEELGFTALWIPDVGGPVLDSVDNLLASTNHDGHRHRHPQPLDARARATSAASYAVLDQRRTATRFLCGIGVQPRSAHRLRRSPGRYRKPLAAHTRVPRRPRRRRAASARREPGARRARPEDAGAAREPRRAVPIRTSSHPSTRARPGRCSAPARWCCPSRPCAPHRRPRRGTRHRNRLRCAPISALPNYANNLLRSGFTQDDLDSVSDRLFDAIIAWGDEDAIVRRVDEHKQAGADHVCVQVLTADPREFPREQWRRLAAALT